MKLFSNLFRTTFLFVFFAELLSVFSYLVPDFNVVCFFVILFLTMILTLTRLEYGLGILFAELFIGSKGYLFYFSFSDTVISIRIAIWLIVMAVWFAKMIMSGFGKYNYSLKPIFKTGYFKYFTVLFFFIGWGLINGYLNNNSFSNIFFDFNGWLYFALIFPVFTVVLTHAERGKELMNLILQVFAATTLWLSFKTLFLLYVFSHNLNAITEGLYRWVRTTGVGEITLIQDGFYRIFFQSHIFILISFFIFALLLIKSYQEKNKKEFFIYYFFCYVFLSVILISLSRSNWVGLIVGLILSFVIMLYLYGWKRTFIASVILLSVAIYSVGFIISIVKFPYPTPAGGFGMTSLLADRATQVTGEAGASSRWSLLPKVWEKIADAPMLGQGFGTTVTYKTSDPRALESSADGNFTTYAFEWGWLDIWLKLSIFGVISYVFLLMSIIYKTTRETKDILTQEKIIESGLLIGLISIAAVSFFSPYLNHPLGIGYLVLVSAITLNNSEVDLSTSKSLPKK